MSSPKHKGLSLYLYPWNKLLHIWHYKWLDIFLNLNTSHHIYGRVVNITCTLIVNSFNCLNHKNYNFLACDWFKKGLFSTNSLAKLLSDSLLLDSLLLDSLLSDSSKSQSHSKL